MPCAPSPFTKEELCPYCFTALLNEDETVESDHQTYHLDCYIKKNVEEIKNDET